MTNDTRPEEHCKFETDLLHSFRGGQAFLRFSVILPSLLTYCAIARLESMDASPAATRRLSSMTRVCGRREGRACMSGADGGVKAAGVGPRSPR